VFPVLRDAPGRTRRTGTGAHPRREFFEAQAVEPHAAARALDFIGELYAVEERIRDRKLTAAKKLDYRLIHAKPIVDEFFAWINQRSRRRDSCRAIR
jgi:hypothetical protein